ncbi:MAG: NAD(P) transhydrogenase subunit beta [Deltaproteobacteria bacterium ADurb.Bin058]|nr:MAG: NAD(P) transhydrogenase subunit beta [Deltaproteobacteria bacterium ADurb.Bin058]
MAEAEVDYEKLLELEESNEEFPKTDVVMIIGACDVVNPAANDPSMDTPLSGMPILEASKAKSVIVCNLDARPGYSGVENPLYDDPKTLMLLGDALGTIKAIRSGLDKPKEAAAATQAPSEGGIPSAAEALRKAERIVVVPGYGMALAQAQFEVIRLTNFLESQGKNVLFAVHPVAGRMPGHMNVLLAEAEVDYEKLLELEESNAEFPRTDVVMIIGACDVVNPAANDPTMDTPLSGMPILEASQAKAIIVCNLDDRPGYSGVENPLYDDPKTTMLLGDALKTIKDIRKALGSSD